MNAEHESTVWHKQAISLESKNYNMLLMNDIFPQNANQDFLVTSHDQQY